MNRKRKMALTVNAAIQNHQPVTVAPAMAGPDKYAAGPFEGSAGTVLMFRNGQWEPVNVHYTRGDHSQ